MYDEIYENMQRHSNDLSSYATGDDEAIYFKSYVKDIRTPFFRDVDRIIYSLSYLRYMDKTQVFSRESHDHIQKRMIHVQYVSKIARTIGRALGLNEDLIEAAALGHDLGHTPFGHEGERALNKISLELGEGYFMHNINSVRNILYVENYGEGQNISLQTIDAIMCHNGELVSNEYYPKPKTKEDFLNEYFDSYKNLDVAKYLRPMTLEGCVVRLSDIIAYIGRDIEDGIRKGLVTFNEVPKNITKVLGKTNSEIVNTLICDVIENSFGKPYIKLSDEVYEALTNLKKFNYENIYFKSITPKERLDLEEMFRVVVNKFLNDLNTKNLKSIIYTSYLDNMSKKYIEESSNARIALDYVSGMTDDYFIKQYNDIKKEDTGNTK